jgi:hypothetical protein
MRSGLKHLSYICQHSDTSIIRDLKSSLGNFLEFNSCMLIMLCPITLSDSHNQTAWTLLHLHVQLQTVPISSGFALSPPTLTGSHNGSTSTDPFDFDVTINAINLI